MWRRQPHGARNLLSCPRASEQLLVTVDHCIPVGLMAHEQRIPVHPHLRPSPPYVDLPWRERVAGPQYDQLPNGHRPDWYDPDQRRDPRIVSRLDDLAGACSVPERPRSSGRPLVARESFL